MNRKRTFKALLKSLENQNARALWCKARVANDLAKIAKNSERLYQQKGKLLSVLHRLNLLYIHHAKITQRGVLLSVTFDGGWLQIFLHQLDKDVQESLAPFVVTVMCRRLRVPYDAQSTRVFQKGGISLNECEAA